MTTPLYGTVFAQWRASCPDAWHAYTQHDFVQGLGNGGLEREAFLTYLRQDYVFLSHFSRAWALAIVKSDSLAEMKAASAIVHALLHEEMQLHVQVCAQEGISLEELENTTELAPNMAYTRYVLEAGYSGDFLDLLAALTPCVMGYGEIGHTLGTNASSTTYKQWIDTYASADYQDLCREFGALLDAAVVNRLGSDYQNLGRWQILTKRFTMATKLEADFWSMAL